MELAEIQPEDQVAILNLFYLGVTLLQAHTCGWAAGRLLFCCVIVRAHRVSGVGFQEKARQEG